MKAEHGVRKEGAEIREEAVRPRQLLNGREGPPRLEPVQVVQREYLVPQEFGALAPRAKGFE